MVKIKNSYFIAYIILLPFVILDVVILDDWVLTKSPLRHILGYDLMPQNSGFHLAGGEILYDLIFVYLAIFTAFLIIKYVTTKVSHFYLLFYASSIVVIVYQSLFYLADKGILPPTMGRFLILPVPNFFSIMNVYLFIFMAFFIIKNYNQFKFLLYDKPIARIVKLVTKHDNLRIDLFHFLELSFLISFLAAVVFAAIGEKSIFNFIPGFEMISDLASNFHAPNLTDINSNYGRFVDPPLGVFIAFILRQIRHREQIHKREKYPGARILLIFLLIVPVILILDAVAIIQEIFDNKLPLDKILGCERSRSENGNSGKTDSGNRSPHVIPCLKGSFYMEIILSPWYYMIIIVTWLFDWFVFSSIWKNLETKTSQTHVVRDVKTKKDDDDPLTQLKKRHVKGEITKEEYEDLKKRIE